MFVKGLRRENLYETDADCIENSRQPKVVLRSVGQCIPLFWFRRGNEDVKVVQADLQVKLDATFKNHTRTTPRNVHRSNPGAVVVGTAAAAAAALAAIVVESDRIVAPANSHSPSAREAERQYFQNLVLQPINDKE